MINNKKIWTIVWIFIVLIFIGTTGYMWILKVGFVDALYMTIITISTVGYTEVGDMNPTAKIFSIFVIFGGVGIVGYTFTSLVVMFVEGKLQELWRGRMANNKISKLSDHYILCGCGNTGEVIVEEFAKKNIDFVVIDGNLETCQDLLEKGILTLHGDATEEEILKEARIDHAKGLISTMSTDVDNIVTVLTARNLNQDLHIISKAIDRTAPPKLIRAGANNTLSITEIGGHRMAALMLRPNIISFLDVITHVGDMELDLENIFVSEGSVLEGKTLKEAEIPQKTGLTVFALKSMGSEKMQVNPNFNHMMLKGDCLIVLGTPNQIDLLKELAGDIVRR